jgi:hypothetical protein
MRWLALTASLLAACVGLVGWVYLRDRYSSQWRLPERQIASVDAARTLEAFAGGCGRRCEVRLLGRGGHSEWVIRLTVSGRAQCLRLDLTTFATDQPHRLAGVSPNRCPRRGLTSPPPDQTISYRSARRSQSSPHNHTNAVTAGLASEASARRR